MLGLQDSVKGDSPTSSQTDSVIGEREWESRVNVTKISRTYFVLFPLCVFCRVTFYFDVAVSFR